MRRGGARARWAVPAGAVAVVGIVIGASTAAGAAVPSLPPRTAAQLLADLAQASRSPVGPFTATVQQTANLGFPQLPASAKPGATSSLTSGTQSIDIWYGGPQHFRVAVPVQAGESDLRRDGRVVWLWYSSTHTATQITLPSRLTGGSGGTPAGTPQVPPTPQAAARDLLTAIGPSTAVSVQSPVYVAGRPAYQLSLVPDSSKSLIGRVLVAIDASRGIPLQVSVFARGSGSLAYQIGFTKLSPGAPATSNFSFTPPPGATVTRQVVPSDPAAALGNLGIPGLSGNPLSSASTLAGTPRVMGSGWLSVVATPPSKAVAAAVRQLLTAKVAPHGNGLFGSSSSAAPGPSASASSSVPVGPYLMPLQALLHASQPVSRSWGHGRLLQTALISVLITSKGQVLAGAVSPAVLYADVARDGG